VEKADWPIYAQPHLLAGASQVYAEETEEPAPVPVGLARHQTKWPCDHIGPPGPPPAGLSPPLDPGGSQWPKYPPSGRPDLLAAPAQVLAAWH
jgi:hypothetical protein